MPMIYLTEAQRSGRILLPLTHKQRRVLGTLRRALMHSQNAEEWIAQARVSMIAKNAAQGLYR